MLRLFRKNIRALANMSKHDFNWPENFPGGLKGLVKMALKEAQDLIADGNERDDSKSVAVEQGMLSLKQATSQRGCNLSCFVQVQSRMTGRIVWKMRF